jgi:hypothetical protein
MMMMMMMMIIIIIIIKSHKYNNKINFLNFMRVKFIGDNS